MNIRKLHKTIGIILLLPFFGWVVTGLIFFIKPGYAEAYETLKIKTYPLTNGIAVVSDSAWIEYRFLKTILGDHLLVRTENGWEQRNIKTLQPNNAPSDTEVTLLLNDAFSANPKRYGTIVSISGNSIRTDTDVEITFDWSRMSLYQKGKDTDRIDLFYKIHYLQWTGIQIVDRYLGLVGLAMVLLLSFFGIRLTFKKM